MNLAILPLAITMMVGPQIMSAIIFVTTPKPLRTSGAFVLGVVIATTVGVIIALAIASLLGSNVSLGDPSNQGSTGHIIQYLFVGLLVALAVKNYLRRETVEPPRWLGTLLSADWKRALMTGLLVIWLMPGDIIVMLTVATNLERSSRHFSEYACILWGVREALPGTEKTIRGFSGAVLLIVDEAARVDDALYY